MQSRMTKCPIAPASRLKIIPNQPYLTLKCDIDKLMPVYLHLFKLEDRLGGNIRIQRFFDLIAETSTGALIALGLGIKDWILIDCENTYKSLCNEAFIERVTRAPDSRLASFIKVGNYGAAVVRGSLYSTRPLEGALRREFGDSILCGARVSTIDVRSNDYSINSTLTCFSARQYTRFSARKPIFSSVQ
jgi:patatin-like phospholipase/acyl hydrolase